MDDSAAAMVGKAIGHPVRIRIMRLLATQTECRGADLFSEIPLAQSTISEHLRVLKAAGLVTARADGTNMVYCLSGPAVAEFISAITPLATGASCASASDGC